MGEQKVYLSLYNGLKGDNFNVLIPCDLTNSGVTLSQSTTIYHAPPLPPFQNGEKHCNQQNFKNYIRFNWKYSIDSVWKINVSHYITCYRDLKCNQ